MRTLASALSVTPATHSPAPPSSSMSVKVAHGFVAAALDDIYKMILFPLSLLQHLFSHAFPYIPYTSPVSPAKEVRE